MRILCISIIYEVKTQFLPNVILNPSKYWNECMCTVHSVPSIFGKRFKHFGNHWLITSIEWSLGWVEFTGPWSCQTWVFHIFGWVFHKFTENGEFYKGWFLPLTGRIEIPALSYIITTKTDHLKNRPPELAQSGAVWIGLIGNHILFGTKLSWLRFYSDNLSKKLLGGDYGWGTAFETHELSSGPKAKDAWDLRSRALALTSGVLSTWDFIHRTQ